MLPMVYAAGYPKSQNIILHYIILYYITLFIGVASPLYFATCTVYTYIYTVQVNIYIYTVQVAKYKGEATPINNVM